LEKLLLVWLWIALPYCLYGNWFGRWLLAQGGVNWGWVMVRWILPAQALFMRWRSYRARRRNGYRPRIGKFDSQEGPKRCPATTCDGCSWYLHSRLWLFGFNPGSTLAVRTEDQLCCSQYDACGIVGALAAMCALMIKGLKPDPTMMCNACLPVWSRSRRPALLSIPGLPP